MRHTCNECGWGPSKIDAIEIPENLVYCIPETPDNTSWSFRDGPFYEPRCCAYENDKGFCRFFKPRKFNKLKSFWKKLFSK